jgi:hypothetical protein
MTELVAALLLFLSVSVFLAHAFEAYLEMRSVTIQPHPKLELLSSFIAHVFSR